MNNITNQELKKPTKVKGLLSNQTIGTLQQNYPLTELDFELIQNGKSQINNWANNIFLTSIGYGLGLLKKFFDNNETISNSELKVLGIAIAIPIILYIIGFFIPSKRKKVIKDIQEHFDKAPKQQIFMEQK
jgi:hypothetical protein